ncbi:MAG: murein L,D-transpeptidase catalytic domain family protein [Bacteroidales bacterium]|nr:murein L,D-transpeptidase catalytic domain family protein [Bacteroidales bacterium]
MNRYILFIIIILISGIYLHGMQLTENSLQENVIINDSSYTVWKERLTDSYGIPAPAINLALNGYFALKSKKLLQNDSLLTIIDFSSPSTERRLFVLDLKNQKIVKNTLVAHGKNSGVNIAESFSNKRHSRKSSLGLYLTNETYFGKHGYSLRLDGMSNGLNDQARKRAIVIHGANYVSDSFIENNGRIGRSFGCPALPNNEAEEIINLIKDGSCLFIYHPSLIPISQSDLEKLP